MAKNQTRRGTPKRHDPLSYEAIADAYRQELRTLPGGGPFSDYALVRLRRVFEGRRLAAITDEAVRDYALRREKREGAAPEIINVELDTLWKIQLFAVKHGLITNEQCCRIEKLPVPAPAALSSPDSRRGSASSSREGFGLRRDRWFKPVLPPAAPAPANLRGGKTKLTPEALDKHLKDAPLDKLNPDGTPFSAGQRLPLLKKDGTEISANRLNRRLKELKDKPS